jgi:hypothetical protein
MPCIFCIAAVALIAGALATAVADRVESGLSEQATGPVRRAVDTDSVAKWELDVAVGAVPVPVAVTLYKESGRVRIQVLSHALSPQQVQELYTRLCAAIGAQLVSQSGPDDETHGEHDVDVDVDVDVEPGTTRPRYSAASRPNPAPRQRK